MSYLIKGKEFLVVLAVFLVILLVLFLPSFNGAGLISFDFRRADVDGDGAVDEKDFDLIKKGFGSRIGEQKFSENSKADILRDGKIDLLDVVAFSKAAGETFESIRLSYTQSWVKLEIQEIGDPTKTVAYFYPGKVTNVWDVDGRDEFELHFSAVYKEDGRLVPYFSLIKDNQFLTGEITPFSDDGSLRLFTGGFINNPNKVIKVLDAGNKYPDLFIKYLLVPDKETIFSGETMIIEAALIDVSPYEFENISLELIYTTPKGQSYSFGMYDDGIEKDRIEGDFVFATRVYPYKFQDADSGEITGVLFDPGIHTFKVEFFEVNTGKTHTSEEIRVNVVSPVCKELKPNSYRDTSLINFVFVGFNYKESIGSKEDFLLFAKKGFFGDPEYDDFSLLSTAPFKPNERMFNAFYVDEIFSIDTDCDVDENPDSYYLCDEALLRAAQACNLNNYYPVGLFNSNFRSHADFSGHAVVSNPTIELCDKIFDPLPECRAAAFTGFPPVKCYGVIFDYQVCKYRYFDSDKTTVHEIGHSFGKLKDEYIEEIKNFITTSSNSQPNCLLGSFDNCQIDSQNTLWGDLLGYHCLRGEREIDIYGNLICEKRQSVGCQEGCRYKAEGIYRAYFNTIMRDHRANSRDDYYFGLPNARSLCQRIYEEVGEVDEYCFVNFGNPPYKPPFNVSYNR